MLTLKALKCGRGLVFARLSGRLYPKFLEVSRYLKLSPSLGWSMALRCLEYLKAAFHAEPAHPQLMQLFPTPFILKLRPTANSLVD